ncbi:TPA: hypothetical protein KDY89_004410 [Vibrio parahaemolyticus]|nr:hypothetical protein [Vibrio parahaemolyticus]
MSAQKCPLCGDAKDFFVTHHYQLQCGYCGFTIGDVKSLWQSAKEKANASNQSNLSRRKK